MNTHSNNLKCVGLLLLLLSVQQVSAYYDPGVQRWINRDPIGEEGGVNLFALAVNNAVNVNDLFGECPLASPMAADLLVPGPPQPMSAREALRHTGIALAAGAATVGLGAAVGVIAEAGPVVLAWAGVAVGAVGNPQAQKTMQPMLAAIDKCGRLVTSPDLLLSHSEFARRLLGVTGTSLPPGTWVGTVGTVNGQITALNSITFYGNQLPANPQVQQAVRQALQ